MTQLISFDVTISVANAGDDHQVVGKRLAELAKNFVFQKETGAGGFEHYQVRMQTRKRYYLGQFITAHKDDLWNGHISATSTGTHTTRNFNYVMKLDSRVGGPWQDTDFNLRELPVMTRQLKAFMEKPFYQWQSETEALIGEEDDRKIRLYFDIIGNIGKSIFCEYLEYKGLATEIPPFTKLEDIMNCVQVAKNRKAFVIDMPRSIPKNNLEEFYAGIETIKNGVCYDKRYNFKKTRFNRPQVLVFTNQMPHFNFLSKDRWVIYTILRDYSMKRLSIPEAIKLQKSLDRREKKRQEVQEALRADEVESDLEEDPLAAPIAFPIPAPVAVPLAVPVGLAAPDSPPNLPGPAYPAAFPVNQWQLPEDEDDELNAAGRQGLDSGDDL
jgi:hypothetical protein